MDKANLTNEVSFGLQQRTGQNILLGIQQLERLVDPNILERLRAAIRSDTFNIGLSLSRALENDIRELAFILPSKQDLIATAKIQDSITKATIEKALSDAIEPLPTQEQIMPLLNRLNIAMKDRDTTTQTRIAEQLHQLLSVAPATAMQLQEINQLIEEATPTRPARRTETAAPAGAIETTADEKSILIELFRNLKQTTKTKKPHSYYNLPTNLSDATVAQLKAAIGSIRTQYNIPQEERTQGFEFSERTQGKGIKGCGIAQQSNYTQFGKFLIHNNKLNNNIISIKRMKGGNVADIPVRRISNDLGAVIRTIAGNGQPEFDDLGKLTTVEKEYLHRISKRSNILDRLSLPTPNKTEMEKDNNQFEIYKGEILNGNDSTELIKKFKLLIIKMIHNESLPKGQAKEILLELAHLGY